MAGYAGHWSKGVYSGPNAAGVAATVAGGGEVIDGKVYAKVAADLSGMHEPESVIGRLVDIGGNRWQKNGMDRIYFDEDRLAALYGLRVTRFRSSGGISSATLDGEVISNNAARRVMSEMPQRFHYDLKTGQFNAPSVPRKSTFDVLVKTIREKAAVR